MEKFIFLNMNRLNKLCRLFVKFISDQTERYKSASILL